MLIMLDRPVYMCVCVSESVLYIFLSLYVASSAKGTIGVAC
jgi:hypothetical protein